MSDTAPREWRFYLDDMISFAEKVIAYTQGLDQDRFVSSGLNYDATLRNLELIGEAAPIYRMTFASPIRKSPGVSSSPPATGSSMGISASITIPCGASSEEMFPSCSRT